MALIIYLMLMGVLAGALWRIATRIEDRAAALRSFKARPLYNLFMIGWLAGTSAFVFGVFAPVIGELRVIEGGLKLWQAGGLIALFGFLISRKFH
jgi:hypothetical protein